jgi:hypothetical protein
MSLFNLFNKKPSRTIDDSQIQLIQGMGSTVVMSLSDITHKTLRQVLEEHSTAMGLAEDMTNYTISCKNRIICSKDYPSHFDSTMKYLLDQNLIQGGDTLVASVRSDSKARA